MADPLKAALDAAHEATACRVGEPGWTGMLDKSPYDLIDIAVRAAAPHIRAAERERIAATDLHSIRRAISDPGSITARLSGWGVHGDEHESLPNWQARAVLAVLARNPTTEGDTDHD